MSGDTAQMDYSLILSDRQREIISMLAMGYTVKDIGRYLGIARRTVYFHLSNAMQKTGAKTTCHLIGSAVRFRWVSFMFEDQISKKFAAGGRSGRIMRIPLDE